MSYMCGNPLANATRMTWEGAATTAQTVIPVPGGYVPGMNDVYVGGACLSKGDYADADGLSITLAKAMALGTQWRIVCYAPTSGVSFSPNNFVLKSGDTMTGDLTFTQGRRIKADFSNSLQANRSHFQTTVANQNTLIGTVPTGTGTTAGINCFGSSDPDNSIVAQLTAQGGEARLSSLSTGSAANSSLSLYTGGASRYSITAAGQHWFAGSNIISAIPLVLTAAVATSGAAIQFSPGSSLRYFLGWDSNNFTLNRYNASGTYQNTPFYVRDTDGAVVYGTAIIAGTVQASSVNTNGLIVNSGISCTGNSIELGPVAAGPAYLDLHSSGNAVDFDSRMIATGGNTTAGNGALDIYTGTLNLRASYGITNLYGTSTLSAMRLIAGSYMPFERANAGNTSWEWINSANSAVNMTLTDAGGLNTRGAVTAGAGMLCNGVLQLPSTLWMQGANTIRLDGGGYSGFLRGDVSGLVGFINQAGNNWTMQIKDSGQIWCSNQWQWGDVSNLGGQFNGSGSIGGHTEASALVQCSNNVNLYLGHTGGGGTLEWFGVAGNGVGTISCNTSITSYNTSSDYRLKENVAPLTGALDRVLRMKPSTFNFIADPTSPTEGFLAHELQAECPGAVTGEKDAMDHAIVYRDGCDRDHPQPDDILEVTEEMRAQQVDYAKLTPVLTAAIQELSAKLDAALTRIVVLEGGHLS